MKTVNDIFIAFGGTVTFARVINVKSSTASEMRRRHSIPVRHWPRVIEAAQKLRVSRLSAEKLMQIHCRPLTAPAALRRRNHNSEIDKARAL